MTPHELHLVWNHRSFDCLCNSLCGLTSKKHQSPYYWPFVRGIHRWPVNSPHKGPVTRRKASIWLRHHVGTVFLFALPVSILHNIIQYNKGENLPVICVAIDATTIDIGIIIVWVYPDIKSIEHCVHALLVSVALCVCQRQLAEQSWCTYYLAGNRFKRLTSF